MYILQPYIINHYLVHQRAVTPLLKLPLSISMPTRRRVHPTRSVGQVCDVPGPLAVLGEPGAVR
jgi:hypothetical protein